MKNTLIYISLVVFFTISCIEDTKNIESDSKAEQNIPINTIKSSVYVSEWFPLSFSCPSSWKIAEDTNLSMIHLYSPTDSSDFFQEMINVVIGGTRGKDLDDFFDANQQTIEKMFEELVETEKPSYEIINGIKFKKVRYNYVFEGLPLTAQLYVAVQQDLSYILNCSALQNTYDNYEKDFNSIINSFTIHKF